MGKANTSRKASEVGHREDSAPDTLPGYMLIPGGPNRISVMAGQWDPGVKEGIYARQHRGAYGTYRGTPIGAWNTGVGGPSTEFVLNNLMAAGAHTFIRVGTTGTLDGNIGIGDIIINDACVRLDGTSDLYVMKEYPAAMSLEVTFALIAACEELGFPYHVGTGCTSGSFFAGQCRTLYNGYRPSWLDAMYADLKQANVINFEMEGATVATLCRVMGKRAGMCAAVIANRETGEFVEDPAFEANASLVGAEAVHILSGWDRKKQELGKKYYYPGL